MFDNNLSRRGVIKAAGAAGVVAVALPGAASAASTGAESSGGGGATVAAIQFSTQPRGSASGSALTVQPVLRLVDSGGVTVESSTNEVTVTASNGTLTGTTSVNAVGGVATFTDLVMSGQDNTYTLTFTVTSLGFTATSYDVYSIRSIGPAGGYVFAVTTTAVAAVPGITAGGHYLECAPLGWGDGIASGGSTTADPQMVWVDASKQSVYVTGIAPYNPGGTDLTLGSGAENTKLIIDNSESSAAKVCADLTKYGFSDWYLPSNKELEAIDTNLYRYNANSNLAQLASGRHWSSTEQSTTTAAAMWPNNNINGQLKSGPQRVRPVRVFSPEVTALI
jgi:hypothetical protein